MTIRLTGKEVAAAIMADNLEKATALAALGHKPTLMVFRVGSRPDDVYYEGSIIKNCEKAGIDCKVTVFAEDVAQEEVAAAVATSSADENVDGIFFFSPMPKSLDEDALRQLVPASKDVDSLSMASAGKVFAGDKTGFAPCTPTAVMEILKFYEIPMNGASAVVLGRSMVVGKPMAMLLLEENATVTICHSRTKDLAKVCQGADILVAAVGRAKMVDASYTNPNQVVIDVGINEDPDNAGKMCGDVNYDLVAEVAKMVTPVPAGVGSVTTAVLCKHVIEAALNR